MIAYHRVVTGEIPSEVFAGKIVLVGATTPTLHDIFPTPFASQSGMSGVEIHAHTLETLFQGIPLRRAPRFLVPVVAVLAGAAAAWIATALRPLPAFGVVAAGVGGYLAASHGAFLWGRYWIEVVPVPLALLITYAGTVAKNFTQEQREKRRLSRFFSPDVVRRDRAAQGRRQARGQPAPHDRALLRHPRLHLDVGEDAAGRGRRRSCASTSP